MKPTHKNLAKFYANFKVHKPHKENTAPPSRPIISCSGSITENLGIYVDHFIKKVSTKHDLYLQDTPDFLRKIDKTISGPKLPKNSMLVTMDAIGAYTNIPQDNGIDCLKEALDERKDKTIPSDFIAGMMELLLKHNFFKFQSLTWRQLIGTTMGVVPAPDEANIARRIDRLIKALAQKYEQSEKSKS